MYFVVLQERDQCDWLRVSVVEHSRIETECFTEQSKPHERKTEEKIRSSGLQCLLRDTTVPIIYIDVTDPILCGNDNTYKQFYLVSEASLIYLRRA